MSSNDFLLLERPSIVEVAKNIAAGDGRASFGASYATDRWFASGYLTGNSWGDSEDVSRSSSQIGTVLRAAGRPITDDDLDVHLGFSGSYVPRVLETSDGQTLRLRDWPEVRLDARRTVDTGDIPADQAWTWGPEFGLRWRNFLVQGEFIQIGVERSEGGSDPSFPGGYVEGSWVLTGEPRSYSASSAAFTRPKPSHPVSFTEGKNGGWGAWELSSRYSIIDLNDKGTEGGKQSIVGLGLSWYPTDMLRFVLQGDYVDLDKEDDSNDFFTLALRSQLAF
jgi:phosphate-selective porin OprO/OprP